MLPTPISSPWIPPRQRHARCSRRHHRPGIGSPPASAPFLRWPSLRGGTASPCSQPACRSWPRPRALRRRAGGRRCRRDVAQALDAAEAVVVDYRQLPAVSDVTRAMAQDVPQIWPEAPATSPSTGRKATPPPSMRHLPRPPMSSGCGCSIRDWRRAPWSHARRSPPTIRSPALHPYRAHPGRGGGAQNPDRGVFKVPTEKIRVLTHDVGGGFGMKVQTYPEYAACSTPRAASGGP